MTNEELAIRIDRLAYDYDPYDYNDNLDITSENNVINILNDLNKGNYKDYISGIENNFDEDYVSDMAGNSDMQELYIEAMEIIKILKSK